MNGKVLAKRKSTMKKLIALFMTLCVSVALVGCGDAAKKDDKKPGGSAPAAGEKKPEDKK